MNRLSDETVYQSFYKLYVEGLKTSNTALLEATSKLVSHYGAGFLCPGIVQNVLAHCEADDLKGAHELLLQQEGVFSRECDSNVYEAWEDGVTYYYEALLIGSIQCSFETALIYLDWSKDSIACISRFNLP